MGIGNRWIVIWATAIACGMLAGCGGGDGEAPSVPVVPAASAPTISAQPQSVTVAIGQPVTLRVEATGTGMIAYQWRKGGTAIVGATGASMTIGAAQASDSGSYDVVVSNAVGSVTSNAATIAASMQAPVITAQPRATTAAAGYPVSFAVTATGIRLSYQWKRNGAAISGATAPTLTIASTAASDAGAAFSVDVTGGGVTVASATVALDVLTLNPVAVNYTSFDSKVVPLYAWEGRRTALLTVSNALSFPAMASIVGAADASYNYYRAATGYTPGAAKTFNRKLTIAQVPTTCGAGCGYLGATGIELLSYNFDILYNGVNQRGEFDQTIFYELGRNFWSLSPKLTYKSPDSDAVVTGFAVFMRFTAMEAASVRGASFGNWTFADFRTRVERMVDLYEADASQTFANTLKVGRAQANNPSALGATDLFASICLRLRRDYGGDAFVQRLWYQVAQRPNATTTQDAVDNFVVAASIAANRNLTSTFTTKWRWPVSAAAQANIASLPT